MLQNQTKEKDDVFITKLLKIAGIRGLRLSSMPREVVISVHKANYGKPTAVTLSFTGSPPWWSTTVLGWESGYGGDIEAIFLGKRFAGKKQHIAIDIRDLLREYINDIDPTLLT